MALSASRSRGMASDTMWHMTGWSGMMTTFSMLTSSTSTYPHEVNLTVASVLFFFFSASVILPTHRIVSSASLEKASSASSLAALAYLSWIVWCGVSSFSTWAHENMRGTGTVPSTGPAHGGWLACRAVPWWFGMGIS